MIVIVSPLLITIIITVVVHVKIARPFGHSGRILYSDVKQEQVVSAVAAIECSCLAVALSARRFRKWIWFRCINTYAYDMYMDKSPYDCFHFLETRTKLPHDLLYKLRSIGYNIITPVQCVYRKSRTTRVIQMRYCHMVDLFFFPIPNRSRG